MEGPFEDSEGIFPSLTGVFDIEFVGGKRLFGVKIVRKIVDHMGHPILLIEDNKTRYNWTTIIRMSPVGD